MNLWKLIACFMLLGLLSSMSFAQRARLATGGTTPGARLPNASTLGRGTTHTPIPAPSAPQKTQPNAATSPAARTVGPNANTTPNRVTPPPNSREWGNQRGLGPTQF